MDRVVSATEARVRFGELMRKAVENHETIVVERGGKSHVVVISVEEYERLRKQQQQGDWRELVHGARAQIQAELAACRRETISPQAGLMVNWFPA